MARRNQQRQEAMNSLAERVLDCMLDDIAMDIALQAHREMVLSRRPCPTCQTRCGHDLNHGPTPEDEKPLAASLADSETGKPGSNVILKCSNCDQKVLITCVKRTKSIDAELLVASSRYAPHLSSCLGLGTSRRAAARAITSKPSMDSERFASPAITSDASVLSDDGLTPKSKSKSKAKRTDEAEFNLHRKRATPQGSPKKSERTRPLIAAGTLSRVPSKLRESSLASFAGQDGDVNMASRETSPDDGLFSEESPVVSRNPVLPRQSEPAAPSYASSQNSHASAPVADYLNDVDGDETDSATDSDDSA